jgi:hypothetical protein
MTTSQTVHWLSTTLQTTNQTKEPSRQPVHGQRVNLSTPRWVPVSGPNTIKMQTVILGGWDVTRDRQISADLVPDEDDFLSSGLTVPRGDLGGKMSPISERECKRLRVCFASSSSAVRARLPVHNGPLDPRMFVAFLLSSITHMHRSDDAFFSLRLTRCAYSTQGNFRPTPTSSIPNPVTPQTPLAPSW